MFKYLSNNPLGIGLIRFLLASAVVFAHTSNGEFKFVPGSLAVESFFVISGFYMMLILSGKYASASDFYLSRYLRLFPFYILCALLALVMWDGNFFKQLFDLDSWAAFAFLVFSNFTMLFQDAALFLGVGDGNFELIKSFYDAPQNCVLLKDFLLIPPAWSLGTEISFYILAPFILKLRDRTLIGIICAALFLKAALVFAGFNSQLWNYRFFPVEILFFIVGSLLYRHLKFFKTLSKKVLLPSTLLIVLFTAFFGNISEFLNLAKLSYLMPVYLIFFAISLPMLFIYSGKSKLDRTVGDMSYGIYICHVLFMRLGNAIDAKYGTDFKSYTYVYPLAILGLSALAAYCFNVLIQDKIDKFRWRFAKGKISRELNTPVHKS